MRLTSLPFIVSQPFIEACVENKNLSEASKYIVRLADHGEKMEWLCQIGYVCAHLTFLDSWPPTSDL